MQLINKNTSHTHKFSHISKKKYYYITLFLQSGVTDMEEKVQYQSEERLRDMQEKLEGLVRIVCKE